jgi:hypothetical protein
MKENIPDNTKIFLSYLMEQKINSHPNDWSVSFKSNYQKRFSNLITEKDEKNPNPHIEIDPKTGKPVSKKPEKPKMSKSAGGGAGIGSKESDFDPNKDMTPDNIMFGDEAGPLGFGAAYAIGKGADLASKIIPQKAIEMVFKNSPQLKQIFGSNVGSIVKKGLETVADISGQSVFDVNFDDIAYQSIVNTLGGAGGGPRPFFRLQVPIRRDDPMDYWRRSQYLYNQP